MQEPQPVKLVMPLLSNDPERFVLARDLLNEHFGPIDYASDTITFDVTDYYQEEMGAGLLRKFYAYERLIDPGQLANIKRLTNALEGELAVAGKRTINLDPGYLSYAKFVLATTKNRAHRIYLGQGIYAEITLSYHHKAFQTLPWTYPDYASPAYLQVLKEIRDIYAQQMRDLRGEA